MRVPTDEPPEPGDAAASGVGPPRYIGRAMIDPPDDPGNAQSSQTTRTVGRSLVMPYRIAEPFLDSQRLTVLGVMMSVGISGGLGVGAIIGGLMGVGIGLVVGVGVPLLLARAFRYERTRIWLRRLADWAIGAS
jgi:hypothetical protein